MLFLTSDINLYLILMELSKCKGKGNIG